MWFCSNVVVHFPPGLVPHVGAVPVFPLEEEEEIGPGPTCVVQPQGPNERTVTSTSTDLQKGQRTESLQVQMKAGGLD